MRGLEIEVYGREQDDEAQASVSVGRGGGSSGKPDGKRWREEPPELSQQKAVEVGPRAVVLDRDHEYRLRSSEEAVLYDIGRFRVVAARDLADGLYGDARNALQPDLRSLREQGLISRFSVVSRKAEEKLSLVVLTKAGKRVVERVRRGEESDRIYRGFVKPAEAVHDAMLYRMFRTEERRIKGEGGVVKKVALDYELKGKAYADLGKAWRSRSYDDYVNHQAAVAAAHGLPIVNGHMVFPDVRVEYENAQGELSRVDLELATENYRAGHISAKVQAGFRLYAPGALMSGKLRGGFLNDREISAGIFAL